MIDRLQDTITHNRILVIALPIILANVSIPLLGAVDTAVVGQMGEAAPIGAVGLGASIFSVLYGLFLFLRMGTSGLAGQARGRGERDEVAAMLMRSVMIGIFLGIVLVILQVPLFSMALHIAPASDEVEGMTRQYLAIRVWSAPAAIALFGLTGWLIANERTVSVLILQLTMNGLNMVLDIVFVLFLDLAVPGVAMATLAAEWVALFLGILLCRHTFGAAVGLPRGVVLDRARIGKMVIVNSDIMIRTVLLMVSITTFMFFAADLGDVTLAANQVLLQILFVAIFAIDGFSFAAEALVGMTTGSRNLAALRKTVILVSIWGMGLAVVTSLMVWLTGPVVIDGIAKSGAVRAAARDYLVWMAFVPVIGTPSWLLDGIFIGAVRAREMRNGMIISFIVFCIVLAITLPLMQNSGLWLSWTAMLVFRALTLGCKYPRIEKSIVQ